MIKDQRGDSGISCKVSVAKKIQECWCPIVCVFSKDSPLEWLLRSKEAKEGIFSGTVSFRYHWLESLCTKKEGKWKDGGQSEETLLEG